MGHAGADRDALFDGLRTRERPPESGARVLLQLGVTALVLVLVLGVYAWRARRTHAARELVMSALPLIERGDPASLRLACEKLAGALDVAGAREAATAGLAEAHAMLWVDHGFEVDKGTARSYTARTVAAGSHSAPRYVAEALVALGEGRATEAARIVGDVLERGGVSERLFWVAGLVALAEGDPRSARDKLKRATELKGQAPHYARALGDALEDLGDSRDASQAWEMAAKANPEYVPGVARDLFSRIRRGEARPRAAADLTRESAKATAQIGPRARAALLHAEAELRLQSGALDEALRTVNAAIGVEGESSRLLALRGAVLLADGSKDQGLRALAQAHERAPRADRYLYELVDAQLAAGKGDEALRLLATQESQRSSEARFHAARGDALLAQGAFDKAAAAYRKALALDAASPEALLGQGVLAARERKGDKALAWFQKALLARPKFPEVYVAIGLMFAAQGALPQADQQLDLAEQLFRATDADATQMLRFYASVQQAFGSTRRAAAFAQAWGARKKAYAEGTLKPLP